MYVRVNVCACVCVCERETDRQTDRQTLHFYFLFCSCLGGRGVVCLFVCLFEDFLGPIS